MENTKQHWRLCTQPVIGSFHGHAIPTDKGVLMAMKDGTYKFANDLQLGDELAASDGAVVVQITRGDDAWLAERLSSL